MYKFLEEELKVLDNMKVRTNKKLDPRKIKKQKRKLKKLFSFPKKYLNYNN